MKSILRLIIGISLLLIITWKVDLLKVIDNFSILSLNVIIYSSVIYLGAWLIAAYKWNILIPSVNYKPILSLSFVGQFYSLFLPGQIAGEVYKAVRLSKARPDVENITASVFIDKLIGLIGLLVVAALGLSVTSSPIPKEISLSIDLLILLVFSGLFSLKPFFIYNYLVYFLKKLSGTHPYIANISMRLLLFIDGWRIILNHPLKLLKVLVLSLMVQICCVFYISLLAFDAGLYLPFADWCWVFGIVSVAVLAPITIGGIGIREGAFVGALSILGIPIEKSIYLSFLVFAISLLGVFIGGFLEIFRFVTSSVSNKS